MLRFLSVRQSRGTGAPRTEATTRQAGSPAATGCSAGVSGTYARGYRREQAPRGGGDTPRARLGTGGHPPLATIARCDRPQESELAAVGDRVADGPVSTLRGAGVSVGTERASSGVAFGICSATLRDLMLPLAGRESQGSEVTAQHSATSLRQYTRRRREERQEGCWDVLWRMAQATRRSNGERSAESRGSAELFEVDGATRRPVD